LGWIGGEVVAIKPQNNLPVPHMGWNSLNFNSRPKIAENLNSDVYFVHSYKMECDKKYVVATSSYCGAIYALLAKDNIFGVQYHPEKSQKEGLQLIQNFLNI
jgi:glutamine amidotransferase